jgi:hypothetical protein
MNRPRMRSDFLHLLRATEKSALLTVIATLISIVSALAAITLTVIQIIESGR